ncbi:MAG: glycosyltransferase [Proteobacteria bacterium]|nr:glycosyltransferase [Pseudomonadota bacterium]
MQKPIKVFLFGGEGTGWALDADVAVTLQSLTGLSGLVYLTPLKDADVVHSVWEEPLLALDPAVLEGKRIICHACNDVMRLHEGAWMLFARQTIGLWIGQAQMAVRDLKALGLRTAYIPYSVDTEIFTPSLPGNESAASLRSRWGVPPERFVISNFMRDSSAQDLFRPKEQKAPELFLEIIKALRQKNAPIHVLLAGPRRHWLKSRLKEAGIGFTFIGKEMPGDDNRVNILPPQTINQLYHISDLHLVTSRWEGGPRAVLEAAATRTAVFSTRVGIAPDILEPECIFETYDDAVVRIEDLIKSGRSHPAIDEHLGKVVRFHTPKANIPLLRDLYETIDTIPCCRGDEHGPGGVAPGRKKKARGLNHCLSRLVPALGRFIRRQPPALTISLWHEFHKPPYGGGNQFMLALKTAMTRRGVKVVVNKLTRDVDVHICNSAWFDTELFAAKSKEFPVRMIHRIDGPVTFYRGEGAAEDDRIFSLNNKLASATVFQSAFSCLKSAELGYNAVSPVIIHNAVDETLFYPAARVPFSSTRKIRLISSAWSDNPRKGGPFYKWLDENLDWDRFEYTFVGRVKQRFSHINHIEAQGSKGLADLLRRHDIYITASRHEPCSNALLEALACGLPALYRNDGGNPELVGYGGLPFNDERDVLSQLDRLVAGYDAFRAMISIRSMDEIAGRYIDLAEKMIRL